MASVDAGLPAKSKRVRTGCLTCRERHLKCDEGVPECQNCRKSNRECKRGVRLNFIDIQVKTPPYVPPTVEWSVQFQDESRTIASEYVGGLGRYAKLIRQATSPREPEYSTTLRQHYRDVDSANVGQRAGHRLSGSLHGSQSLFFSDKGHMQSDPFTDGQLSSRKNSDASFMAPPGPPHTGGFNVTLQDALGSTKDDGSRDPSLHAYKGSDVSSAASTDRPTGIVLTSGLQRGAEDNISPTQGVESGIMTPPNDKNREREYLSNPEELRFMQVFVEEVGIWMDSLDHEKHFSRLIPFHALKCPMLLDAFLACGVKHLTLTQQYSEERALYYYDTATTQLLRNLQNPDRNTAECAVTAVVLNVYEIMSDKPTQRMSHIAGARALIRECEWNAKSTGIGAACFWLNVGMELLSCLAFNWQTAWDPDQWGVDMDFASEKDNSHEEMWVHRIFYIVAKIANFRASVPRFQEPSPHDEQIRLQSRYAEWQRLKSMCDNWNNSCPRSMHPFGYLYPAQTASKSLFPNVWLLKRPAVIGRLYYHMAQCLLAQVNPILARESDEARAVQQHHAHQVCGIVAHAKDRGVSSVAIRSLAIASEVLTSRQEQEEVLAILERITRDTGWRLGKVIIGLKMKWGWEKMGPASLAAQFLPSRPPQPVQASASPQQSMQGRGSLQGQSASKPGSSSNKDNPYRLADFSLPNHPYQNWYEPPSRTNAYQLQAFL